MKTKFTLLFAICLLFSVTSYAGPGGCHGDIVQGTTYEAKFGPFLDDVDGDTAETGLSIASTDIALWKGDGSNAAPHDTNALVHESKGVYRKLWDSTDTDTIGQLIAVINVAGALYVKCEWTVVAAAAFDGNVTTGPSSVNAVRDAILADGTPFNGADIDASLSDIATDTGRLYLVKGGVSKTLLVGPFVSNSNHVDEITSGTAACTLRSNSSATYGSAAHAPATQDGEGFTTWTVDGTESSGKTALAVVCALANADKFRFTIIVQ